MSWYNPLEPLCHYLSDFAGISVDQIRYILLLFLSYPLALIFRHALHPDHTPLMVRYMYSFSLGMLMGLLCFGWEQMGVLVMVVSVSYLLLILIPPKYTQRYSMVWAMGSLATTHIYRMTTDYGGWHLDFTGPLMIMVQKITLAAYALHDGKARRESELSKDQREQKITSAPGPVEYFSYMFNFHSLLAGHSCTMKEYLAFMDGSNFRVPNPSGVKRTEEPSAAFPVLFKLLQALFSFAVYMMLAQYVSNDTVLDPRHKHPYRLLLNTLNCYRLRMRYYFVWILADSINNCAGVGFAGYDKQGRAKWDLVTNINMWEIENATSMRTVAINWNAISGLWLRRCVYERATYAPTLATFIISAWWHGFYPGYYMCFTYFFVATQATRKMRRLVRHYFQSSTLLQVVYALVTWALTRIYLDFGVVSVDVMFANKSIAYWSYYYYIPVISCLVVAVFFPSGKSRKTKDTAVTGEEENNQNNRTPANKDIKYE